MCSGVCGQLPGAVDHPPVARHEDGEERVHREPRGVGPLPLRGHHAPHSGQSQHHRYFVTALHYTCLLHKIQSAFCLVFALSTRPARSSRSVANVNSKQIEIILNPAKPHIQLYLAAGPEIS